MVEISKSYEPTAVEEKWYPRWLESGVFHADPHSPKPAFSIVIPPPNVTGVLTLGHVLNNTIQDILARRARMQGHEVLWLPGTDHAGIATQTVVERTLRKAEGKTRHDLGREEFLKRVWEWKDKHGGIIINQLKKLGCSCDWERERFTMDDAYAAKVQEVFVDLYKKGMIYRGKRMVNWCPASLTALSDEEVISKSQKGTLVHFKVEVIEEPGTFLEIATTRPETIPGDTGVAVNPKDPRYAHLVGKTVRRPLPLENEAAIPIVADDAVDFEFGTGVLKVTPAHDKVDNEIGARHGLEVIDVMNPDGTMNDLAGADLSGLDRFAARKRAVELLTELELLVKEEPYQNNVGFSERADVPIEPRLSEQWFLKYPKTVEARAAVRAGLIRFFPDRWEKVYDHWLENIQDWCISRQLWWGHRVPMWRPPKGIPEEKLIAASRFLHDQPLPDGIVLKYGETHSYATILTLNKITGVEEYLTPFVAVPPGHENFAIELEKLGFEQDPDVLDTWFSSWLWAHDTMDDATRAKFYPTSVLVTGPDIIFFWVARMIMAGLEYTGEIPFRDVYFTGIIRDKAGRKMSKSLGNSPDPLDLIAKFGADGLRFGLMRIAPSGQDIKFDEQVVVDGRNFCNKLWNACRFRTMQGAIDPDADPSAHTLTIFAEDLLHKLDATIARIEEGYRAYRFNDVAQALYDFVWGEFCDKFIEVAKADFYGEDAVRKAGTLATIDFTLGRVLRLLHPYAPFLTEELWDGLGFGTETIQFAPWPAATGVHGNASADALHGAVAQARNLRSTYNLPPNKKFSWALRPAASWVAEEHAVLRILLNAEPLDLVESAPAGAAICVTPIGDIYLPLEGVIDAEAEKQRLESELGKIQIEIAKVKAKLASETFVQNAPIAVVEDHRERQKNWEERLDAITKARAALG